MNLYIKQNNGQLDRIEFKYFFLLYRYIKEIYYILHVLVQKKTVRKLNKKLGSKKRIFEGKLSV